MHCTIYLSSLMLSHHFFRFPNIKLMPIPSTMFYLTHFKSKAGSSSFTSILKHLSIHMKKNKE